MRLLIKNYYVTIVVFKMKVSVEVVSN